MTGVDEKRGSITTSSTSSSSSRRGSRSRSRPRRSPSSRRPRQGRPELTTSQSERDRDRGKKKPITRHGKSTSMNHHHHHHYNKGGISSRSNKNSRRSPSKHHRNKMAFHAKDFIRKRSTTLHPHYTLGTLLGEGGFGVCYTAHHTQTQTERACKVLPKHADGAVDATKEALAEFDMMAPLDHPNIAKVYELYEDDDSFYIITDLYKGGDLFDIVEQGQLNEFNTAQVVRYVWCLIFTSFFGSV